MKPLYRNFSGNFIAKYGYTIHLWSFLILASVTIVDHVIASPNPRQTDDCDNDKFHLTIDNEPEFYVPRSTYTVGIESNSLDTFSSFELTAAPANNTLSNVPILGWFSLMSEDHETQFSPDAINTIVERNTSPKQSVHALWTAPSGHDCLTFKVTINYRTKTTDCVQKIERGICGLRDGNQLFSQIPRSAVVEVGDECCACDEAAYNMVFEGLWSSETHPKDFPATLQLTHFSDIIGCTHSRNLTMWSEGLYATEGLRQVAEFGSGSIMESELLEKKKHLRSLIKVAGLWYPRMNSNATSKFRVDKRHNLLSLASMLGPSPDWFTGISRLNLCTKDCTWVESKVVDLSLYDAGTDNGISYMAPNEPSVPQERVYRITSTYPEDPRAPFYDMHGDDVKPIARLYLRREKVVPKPCVEEPMFDPNENIDSISDTRVECATTNFTDWSPCSTTCGKGLQARTRNYVDPQAAKKAGCNVQLMSKKFCMAPVSCPGESDDDNLLLSDEQCKTGNWSEWSECTATCGIGFMTRTRRFLKQSSLKKCKHVTVYETKKCMEPPCKKTVIEKEMINCTTTEWSEWSPCSVNCGKGLRIRIRHLTVPNHMVSLCKSNITLEERRECIKTKDCVIDKVRAKDVCTQPQEPGPCRGPYPRWYYDSQVKQCVEFDYGGCRGNKNNFLTQDECIRLCSGI